MKNLFLLPLLVAFALSNRTNAQIVETYDNVQIQMRDGEFLEADVYLPSGPGPFEVILIQTPYNKEAFTQLPMGVGTNIDGQPFAWVIVDWRGFYGSSGAASGSTRGQDGYDVCEWITQQSWHADRIGTWGPSALGKVQYDTAFEHHPNHTCAVPLVSHPQFTYDDYFFGGVLEVSKLQQLDALGYGLSPIVLSNVYYSNTWQYAENTTWTPNLIEIPTLQIGGWYDHNVDKMLEWYQAVRSNAAVAVQDQQWLLFGPWVHGGTGAAYVGSSNQGELSYPNAAGVCDVMAWDFFNYYLLDAVNNWQNTTPITYYETGINQWNTSTASTIGGSTNNVLYLDQNETIRSTYGAGSTSFVCDPNNPSPTIGGPTLAVGLQQGPYDQVSLLTRSDVKSFATPTLSQDLHVSGAVSLHVYFESDQPDGDIAIRLVDEYPDGRNMLINDGIRRMRFRTGYTQNDETFVSPGTVYDMVITLPFTDYTWLSGHKLKVLVSGNSDNRWDVNLQNGGTMYQAGTANTANITILHDQTYPSSITLPGSNDFLSVSNLDQPALDIYPNPASDKIIIETNETIEYIRIIDLSGNHVRELSGNHKEINLSSLASGSYLIEVVTVNGLIRKSIVKQ